MAVYLRDIPLPQARERFRLALDQAGYTGVLGVEHIALDEHAAGRVLAEPAWAKISSPHYHAAAMDGFAVRSVNTIAALPSQPVRLVVPVDAMYVDTGDPLPLWADAVIPIEQVESDSPGGNPRQPTAITIRASVTPWQHVRPLGEDMIATQLVLPAGAMLRPADLGALAAAGIHSLAVARRPRVAILPTGNELIPIGVTPKAGEIIEFNSTVLAAQVNGWGGAAQRYAIIPDDISRLRNAVLRAAESADLILVNAGSSAGSEDFTSQVVEQLGEVLVHGVAVRPGHPVILGLIHHPRGKVPIIGVPGYPVSAAMTGEIFIEPLLSMWLGRESSQSDTISARLMRTVNSPAGDDDYLRVAVGRVGGSLLAAPLPRGAGVISSLVRADGVVVIPRGIQGLEAGVEVQVRLYRTRAQVEQTIFAIGSHDLTLDILAQYLAPVGRRLSSVNVGSVAGLVALRRGEAHFAGTHLLDPNTGEYNLSYLKQYAAGVPMALLGWVGREQGLIVVPGNPLQIRSLEDLTRPEVTFINRQRGSGTRVLLDYHLTRMGIAPEAIRGYTQEEYTHLAVAAAVASGRAACGLGIAAAAQALELEFLPLFEEQYHLAVPMEVLRSDHLAPLLDIAASPAFRREIQNMAGYTTTNIGTVLAEMEG